MVWVFFFAHIFRLILGFSYFISGTDMLCTYTSITHPWIILLLVLSI